MSYQLFRSPATHNVMLESVLALVYGMEISASGRLYRQRSVVAMMIPQIEALPSRSFPVVWKLSSFDSMSQRSVCASGGVLREALCHIHGLLLPNRKLSLAHFVGCCGSCRAIRCDLRFKACQRLYVGQLAVFYWVLREKVAACSQ